MIRRFGTPPKKGRSYKLRPGAYAILSAPRGLLVTWQDAPHHEFQLPGGGIDPGETPLQALHRETYEETGWTLADPRRLGAFRRFTYMPEYDLCAEKLCHVYLARPAMRRGPPTEAGHKAIWLSPQEAALALANSGDRYFVAKVFGL